MEGVREVVVMIDEGGGPGSFLLKGLDEAGLPADMVWWNDRHAAQQPRN